MAKSIAGVIMSDVVTALMEANLLAVFGESDAERRSAAIAATYTEDVVWTDEEGVTVGRDALAAKAQKLLDGMQGLVFTKVGEVQKAQNFGHLAWELAPPGQSPVATGFDAAVVTDGRISSLYTVITGPERG
jgi:hypothetical protein